MRNLLNGRVLHRVASGPDVAVGDGIAAPEAVVVTPGGDAAWIVELGAGSNVFQVHVVDRHGTRVVATSGPDISHVLAVSDHTIYWTQGGKPMSATLN